MIIKAKKKPLHRRDISLKIKITKTKMMTNIERKKKKNLLDTNPRPKTMTMMKITMKLMVIRGRVVRTGKLHIRKTMIQMRIMVLSVKMM